MFKLSSKKRGYKSFDDLKTEFSNSNSNNLTYSIDKIICGFSENDPYTISDSVQGIQIFGAIGSGKTSGSGQFLADSFLRSGFGGLILTVKNDEKDLWLKYCQQTNRELIIFSPDSKWRFNFLDYELNRGGRGAGETENIIDLFLNVLELDNASKKQVGESYWNNALKQLLRNTIDLLKFSEGRLSMSTLYRVINSAPQTAKDVKMIVTDEGQEKDTEWMKTSYCAECIRRAWDNATTDSQRDDMDIITDYWTKEFPNLAEKTRSIIVSSFTGFADVFLRGTLKELFATTTNIFPEITHEGGLILIDLPVQEYNKVGQYAQAIFKYVWQRATERRDKSKDLIPVFLWIDEAQYFINSHDVKFQSVSRASKSSTVYLTQNLPAYINAIGENLTYSMLGNLQTKIFHQNSDPKTNQYASDIIGRTWQDKFSTNLNSPTEDPQGKGRTSGSSFSEEVQFDLLPVEFTKLKKGGIKNDLLVEGIVYQGGRIWQANQKSYLKVLFNQQS